MDILKWNTDEVLAVRYQEGFEEGREEVMKEIAQKALANSLSPELTSTITGLDLDTIKTLETRQ